MNAANMKKLAREAHGVMTRAAEEHLTEYPADYSRVGPMISWEALQPHCRVGMLAMTKFIFKKGRDAA